MRNGKAAPNYKDGRWMDDKTLYHKNYYRNNMIYNKFTHMTERSDGRVCPEGLVRHHEYYDLLDINAGIVFITQSEHMKIHQAILFKRLPPIKIYANWRAYNIKL